MKRIFGFLFRESVFSATQWFNIEERMHSDSMSGVISFHALMFLYLIWLKERLTNDLVRVCGFYIKMMQNILQKTTQRFIVVDTPRGCNGSCVEHSPTLGTVSYTHLTLPTILRV